jgi:CDGSH-type Zn-finger protein
VTSEPTAEALDEPTAEALDELPASSVTVYPDGPLVVRGSFEVRAVDGEQIVAGRTVALCRCGRSAVKPFCDGSHKVGRHKVVGQKIGARLRPADSD